MRVLSLFCVLYSLSLRVACVMVHSHAGVIQVLSSLLEARGRAHSHEGAIPVLSSLKVASKIGGYPIFFILFILSKLEAV